jgi:alcohol dehydrogenase class IV
VTKVAVIADPDNDVKLPFAEDQFLPQVAILDPELTLSMPGKLTAATGMDALTHAIEAYVDKECSPASDAMALQAVKLISSNILQACAKPEDVQARGALLVGSFLAGVAFSHSMVGMVHGIAHALGGVYHIPHGIANALVLPEVMLYNLEARVDRFAELGMAMGVNYPQVVRQGKSLLENNGMFGALLQRFASVPPVAEWLGEKAHLARELTSESLDYLGFVDSWMHRQAAFGCVEKVRMLNRQLAYLTKMPLNLKDAGIDDQLAKLDQVVQTAMEDGSMLYNPVEPRKDAVRDIVQKVFSSRETPVCVTSRELKVSSSGGREAGRQGIFKDTEMVYTVLGGFFNLLKDHELLGPALAGTGLCIRFEYQNPSAMITVDASGPELEVFQGDCDRTPEVIMSMNADFAHLFWHGKADLVSALTRRWVRAKGNVPKTLKLLPVLKPAYELYPRYLSDEGFSDLIL